MSITLKVQLAIAKELNKATANLGEEPDLNQGEDDYDMEKEWTLFLNLSHRAHDQGYIDGLRFTLKLINDTLLDEVGEVKSDIETTPDYWDCECKDHYIHKKTDRLECSVCGATQDEQPDSRVEEIPEGWRVSYGREIN